MNNTLFPSCVESFLDHAGPSGSNGPKATLAHILTLTRDGSEGDKHFAALLLSGLVEACCDGIDDPAFDAQSKNIIDRLIDTGITKDIPWMWIKAFQRLEGTPDDNAKWWKATAPCGELSIALQMHRLRNFDRSVDFTSLIGLALLKIGLQGIRVLSRYGDGHHPDSQIAVHLTRLFARCFSYDGSTLDIALLRMGASNAETWETAAQKARNEYLQGGIASCMITSSALEHILARPSPEDRVLCQWILDVHQGVVIALTGWLAGGAWKRSPEVAAEAASWKILRELLFVGAQGSVGTWSSNVWKEKTYKAVSKLIKTPLEQKDGSLRCMRKVVVTATNDGENANFMVDEIISLDLDESPELQALIRRRKS
jgi:hypothetical protein